MPDKENKKQYGEFGDELTSKTFLVLIRGKWIISQQQRIDNWYIL